MTDQLQDGDALLPCPFCGSAKVGVGASLECPPKQWSVLCGDCGASCSLYCESQQDAVASWNTRSTPTAGVTPAPDAVPVMGGDGWQLVPKEPTKDMIQACIWALDRWRENNGNVQGFVPPGDKYQVRWRAMLAAAPAPPKPAPTDETNSIADSTGEKTGTPGASKEAGGHSRGGLTPASTISPKPAPDAVQRLVAQAVCCPQGCQYEGDSEDGGKCYCDTSDYHGSGIERRTNAVLAALSPGATEPVDVQPNYDDAARALGFQQIPSGTWFHPNQHPNFTEHFKTAEGIFDRYFGKHWLAVPLIRGERDIIRDFEDVCEKIAATRPYTAYLAMIDGGQGDLLTELDEVRRRARAILSLPSTPVSDAVAWLVIRGGEDGKYTGLYLTRSEAEMWQRTWKRDFKHSPEIEPLGVINAAPVSGRDAVIEDCAKIAENYEGTTTSRPLRKDYEILIGSRIAAAIRALSNPDHSSLNNSPPHPIEKQP